MSFEQSAPGADEVAVVAWPLVFRQRLARRVEGSERFRWWVLWTVLAGLFSVGFSITVLSVSLPRIAGDLHSNVSTLTWALTGPLLAFGVVGPAFGKAGDIWGQKRVYLLGLAGAGVFAGLTALSWNASSLILFRVLSVAEGAATGPASMALIMRAFPAEDRVKTLGYWSLVNAGAPVLGVVAGGPIVEHFSWRWIFAAQVPFTVLAIVLAIVILPRAEPGGKQPLDVAGAAALSAAATSFLFALNRGPVWGWSSPGVLVGFALVPVTALLFVRVERQTSHPLIPLDWLRRRNFAFPIAAQFFSNFAYMGSFILTPLFLKQAFHYGETHIGLVTIARPLAFALSAPIAGYVATRVGERSAAVTGALAVVASMIALSRLTPASSDLAVMGALALAGIGLGVSSPPLAASVANAVEETSLGIAGAAQQLIIQVGVVAGIQIGQTVQASRLHAVGLVHSFGQAYLLAGGVALVGVGFAAFVRSAPRSPALAA